jgi:hypothetical protein
LLRLPNRFVRQQQRDEIMQRFAIFVNFIFASPQYFAAPSKLNHLISLSFSSAPWWCRRIGRRTIANLREGPQEFFANRVRQLNSTSSATSECASARLERFARLRAVRVDDS